MGLFSFLKDIFRPSHEDEAELQKLRAKHGIKVDEKEMLLQQKKKTEMEDYDPWEEIRNMRTYFFLGSWVTRKFRPIGEEKLKKQLEELERKRAEEEKKEKTA